MMKPLVDDDALSEVIGFVLILGVIAVGLSLYTVYVVPANGREQEITHMDDVFERFMDYKMALDSLWINNENYEMTGVTDSLSFTLGSQGGNIEASGFFLPSMSPIGSSASLAINEIGETITINSSSESEISDVTERSDVTKEFPIPLSRLSYKSNNYYWIPQEYYYQMGGIFLNQTDGVTNRVSPFISISNVSNNASVTVVPIRLYGGGVIAGAGNVRVDSRLKISSDKLDYNISEYNPNDWVKITVNVKDTRTAKMWQNLFIGTARRENIPGGPSGWYTTSLGSNFAYINITGPPDKANDVYLTVKRADYSVTLNNMG